MISCFLGTFIKWWDHKLTCHIASDLHSKSFSSVAAKVGASGAAM